MKINTSLKALMLEGDSNPTASNKFIANINNETFQVSLNIGKNGVDVMLIPVNPEGNMILNLSEDELKMLQTNLKQTLLGKFSKYRMKLAGEDFNTGTKTIKFNIPTESLIEFFKGVMSK